MQGLAASMSWEQFAGWMAFLATDPLPDDKADLRHAAYMAAFASAHRGKSQARPRVRDFIPQWRPEPKARRQSWDELKAQLRAYAEAKRTV